MGGLFGGSMKVYTGRQVRGTVIYSHSILVSPTTPMCRPKLEDMDDEIVLEGDAVTKYRSSCMRSMYLAQDRPDIMIVCRESAKAMQRPTSMRLSLKRFARYLVSHRRQIQHFHHSQAKLLGLECGWIQTMPVAYAPVRARVGVVSWLVHT
eukprot:3362722-Amphidinium_carterae.1